MKLLLLVLFAFSIVSCAKQNEDKVNVTTLGQITGEWQWLSTCGGIVENCTYSSDTNYAVIDFGSNSKYVELHNGIVYMEADYIIIKGNETSGRIRFSGQKYESTVSIVNNQLEIGRGELVDTYKKIN
ncbi:MAG: hypothetical protein Q7U54_12835 [Bacteroidales bacterium]|nr:hypothetical protein [Bacteroidales bacterium]